jgi:hypothetical protein
LMEYGSIFGHGAYLGPDFTADYLHRAALIVIDQYGGPSSEAARQRTIDDFKTNRYDSLKGGTWAVGHHHDAQNAIVVIHQLRTGTRRFDRRVVRPRLGKACRRPLFHDRPQPKCLNHRSPRRALQRTLDLPIIGSRKQDFLRVRK